jgi:hypothetical protein
MGVRPVFSKGERTSMSPIENAAQTAWDLLEHVYIESVGRQTALVYMNLGKTAQRVVLKSFAKEQAARSTRWASIAQNLLSAELNN